MVGRGRGGNGEYLLIGARVSFGDNRNALKLVALMVAQIFELIKGQ